MRDSASLRHKAQEGLIAGHLRRSSFMATSKNRSGILFGRITKKTMIGIFGVCQEKKGIFYIPENPKNSIIQNIGCRHAFIWTA
jgi:hypothetical protein